MFTIAFIGWMGFVTFSSLYSFEGAGSSRFNIPHADKIVHFAFYFVACILGMFFLRERTKGAISFSKALVLIVIFSIGFGTLIEVIQYAFTTTRMADLLDALANSLGAFAGAGAIKMLFTNGSRLKWKV